ncbi:DUF6059 family protein [Streptomyces hokutonensis]|uniref:DUF6059 family protein n=1 Tax=Streptomyces hokutonensis TaxID=1306990 RepID=UPI000374E6CE|nr:DUF6059 family protein [Streptomyces hokutonensis]
MADGSAAVSRERRWADAFARWVPGLLAIGCCLGGLLLPVVPARRPGPYDGPPSGHPECLATHIPPTDVERELWSALDQRV